MADDIVGVDFDPVKLGDLSSFSTLVTGDGTRLQVLVVFIDGGAMALHGEIGGSLLMDVRPAPRDAPFQSQAKRLLASRRVVVREATTDEQRSALLTWAQEAHLTGSTHDCGEWLMGLRCMVCGEVRGR